jgi:hypothetical protein
MLEICPRFILLGCVCSVFVQNSFSQELIATPPLLTDTEPYRVGESVSSEATWVDTAPAQLAPPSGCVGGNSEGTLSNSHEAAAAPVETAPRLNDTSLLPGTPLWNAILDLVRQSAIADARADAAAEVLQAREELHDLQLEKLEVELQLQKLKADRELTELQKLLDKEKQLTARLEKERPHRRKSSRKDSTPDAELKGPIEKSKKCPRQP